MYNRVLTNRNLLNFALKTFVRLSICSHGTTGGDASPDSLFHFQSQWLASHRPLLLWRSSFRPRGSDNLFCYFDNVVSVVQVVHNLLLDIHRSNNYKLGLLPAPHKHWAALDHGLGGAIGVRGRSDVDDRQVRRREILKPLFATEALEPVLVSWLCLC